MPDKRKEFAYLAQYLTLTTYTQTNSLVNLMLTLQRRVASMNNETAKPDTPEQGLYFMVLDVEAALFDLSEKIKEMRNMIETCDERIK